MWKKVLYFKMGSFVAEGEHIFLAFLSWRFGHILNNANGILPSHALIAEVKFYHYYL